MARSTPNNASTDGECNNKISAKHQVIATSSSDYLATAQIRAFLRFDARCTATLLPGRPRIAGLPRFAGGLRSLAYRFVPRRAGFSCIPPHPIRGSLIIVLVTHFVGGRRCCRDA